MRPNTSKRLRVTIVFVVAALVAVIIGSSVALADSYLVGPSQGTAVWAGNGSDNIEGCTTGLLWVLSAGDNDISDAKLFVDFGAGYIEYGPSATNAGTNKFETPSAAVVAAYATYNYTSCCDPTPNLVISHCIVDGTTTTLAPTTTSTTLAPTTTKCPTTTSTSTTTSTTLAPTTTTSTSTTTSTTLAPTTTTSTSTTTSTTLAPTTTTSTSTTTSTTSTSTTSTTLQGSGTTTTLLTTTTEVSDVTSTTAYGWIDEPDDIQTGLGGMAGDGDWALIVLVLASTLLVGVLAASAIGIRAGVL